MKSLMKLLILTTLMGAVLFPVYAFASSGTGEKASGEGAVAISGWTVSNVHYQLSSDPSLVKSVDFDLDAPAGSVSVKLSSKNTAYTSCTHIHGYHWQCDLPGGVSIAGMDEFRMIAVGN